MDVEKVLEYVFHIEIFHLNEVVHVHYIEFVEVGIYQLIEYSSYLIHQFLVEFPKSIHIEKVYILILFHTVCVRLLIIKGFFIDFNN